MPSLVSTSPSASQLELLCEEGGFLPQAERDPPFTIKPYQLDLVEKVFGPKSFRETVAWMAMGTGKTKAAILCLCAARAHAWGAAEKRLPRVLILCPPNLRSWWEKELFACADFADEVRFDAREMREMRVGDAAPGQIFVASYGEIGRLFNSGWSWVEDSEEYLDSWGRMRKQGSWVRHCGAPFLESQWDLVIMDESHTLRNPDKKVKMNQACRVATSSAKKVLLLTGTAVQNSPLDICGQMLAASNVSILSDRMLYKERSLIRRDICNELHERSYKLSLEEANIKLPPIERHQVVIEHGLSDENVDQYNRALHQARRIVVAEYMGRMRKLEALAALRNFLQVMRHMIVHPNIVLLEKDEKGDPIWTEEQVFGAAEVPSAKMTKALELTDELLKSEKKVIIASDSRRALEILQHQTGALIFHGGLSRDEKDDVIEAFLKNEEETILLLTIIAGGEGLNLVPGPTAMVVLNFWYNPARHRQLEARIHRLGQTKPVSIWNLISRGTIDEALLKVHEDKTQMSEILFDNCRGSSKSDAGSVSWKAMTSIVGSLEPLLTSKQMEEEEERKREVKEEPQKPNKGKGKGKARKHKAKAKAQKFKRKVPQHVYGQQLWNQMDGFAMPPNMLPPSFPILPQASYTPMSVPPVPVKREDGHCKREFLGF